MRLPCDLTRQVRGHRSTHSTATTTGHHHHRSWILLSISTVPLLLLLTWSAFIDGVASLNQAHSIVLAPGLIDASTRVRPSQLIVATTTKPSVSSSTTTTATTTPTDKIGKSVPPLSGAADDDGSPISSTIAAITSDTNYRRPLIGAAGGGNSSHSNASSHPGHAVPLIQQQQQHDSKPNFAQQQENQSTSTTTATTAQDDVHDTFLLMCSAHAIRFWSISCPVHSSNVLLSHKRPSAIKFGISTIGLWRPHDQWQSAQLVWFDVSEAQFHRASLQRQHATDCTYLLGIEFNQTLDYSSNPFNVNKNNESTFLAEKRVKLAIDSRNQLLFAANYVHNRIDIYRLDSATVANNEMVWLASIDSLNPYDIAVDSAAATLVWVENRQRICRLEYRVFEDKRFLTLNRNLSSLKNCSEPLTLAPPQALTLDLANRKIIWSSKGGQLYRDDYHLKSTNRTELIGRAEMTDITSLAMSGSDALYLSDDRDVLVFRPNSRKFDFVSIEANTLFGLLLVDNLTMSSVEYSDEAATPTSTSTPSTMPQNISTTSVQSTTPSPFDERTESPVTNRSTTSLTVILLSTLVPLMLILVIVCAIYFLCLRSGSNRIADFPQKFSPFFSNQSARTSRLFLWTQRWARYNQLRKTRAGSTGRDQLIDEDIEQPSQQQQQTFCSDSTSDSPGSEHHHQGHHKMSRQQQSHHFYRQNLMRQSSTMDDIEDMFGHSAHRSQPATCMACRDQDICQDKGICMTTYRVL